MTETQLISTPVTATQLMNNVVEAIAEKKAKDIVVLDLKHIPEAVCQYFVICHGTSTTQVKAIADFTTFEIKNNLQEYPLSVQGGSNAEWVLVDYADVVLHVFLKEKREFYQLEELWSDAKIINYDEDGNVID